MELSRFEPRGWLVAWPDEPVQVALDWFEALAQSVATPLGGSTPPTHVHYTAVWVTEVFNTLATWNVGFWVPISNPGSTPP